MEAMTQHLRPCSDCPFSKKSLAGWLGPHASSGEIVEIAMSDRKYPCHVASSQICEQLEREFKGAFPGDYYAAATALAPHCAGSLAYMNHQNKLSRDRATSRVQANIGDVQGVFKNLPQMVRHHGK